MKIGGLQKTTLLDFPGKVSAVVFTQGCNFRCPYCHNPDLVTCRQDPLVLAELIAFLTQRKKVLEGVVISGGEPTLHDDLPEFCATLKDLGYAIKLDTNGSRPDMLQLLIRAQLLDYVAMDIKGNPKRYPKEIYATADDSILNSIAVLHDSGIAHEYRIPCVAPFIDSDSFQAILDAVPGNASIFLQSVTTTGVLDPVFFTDNGYSLASKDIERLQKQANEYGISCCMR